MAWITRLPPVRYEVRNGGGASGPLLGLLRRAVGGAGDRDILERADACTHYGDPGVPLVGDPRGRKEPHEQNCVHPGCVVEYAHLRGKVWPQVLPVCIYKNTEGGRHF